MWTFDRRTALLVLLGGALPRAAFAQTAPPGIEDAHPAAYVSHGAELFKRGQRDEAVFWFYLGQLRYRIHLQARPTLPRSGDPALFAALMDAVGRPVNEWAFGDLPMLDTTLGRVLAWDDAHRDGYTSKSDYPAERQKAREGLAGLRAQTTAGAEEIRVARRANGLVNRR